MKTIKRLLGTGRGVLPGLMVLSLGWSGLGLAVAQDAPAGLKVPEGVVFERGSPTGQRRDRICCWTGETGGGRGAFPGAGAGASRGVGGG